MNDQIRSKFVDWLLRRVVADARGDRTDRLPVNPAGRFWLGRLAPEERVIANPMGDRGERLDPCATGMRVLIQQLPASFEIRASVTAWANNGSDWHKLPTSTVKLIVPLTTECSTTVGQMEFEQALTTSGADGLKARIDITCERAPEDIYELTVELVNCSPEEMRGLSTNLYECRMELSGIATRSYLLEALPDSFRYDREVPAYGLNCGVQVRDDGSLVTTDVIAVDKSRPNYWGPDTPTPDFSFSRLSEDPIPAARELIQELIKWGAENWSKEALERRAVEGNWSTEMMQEALSGSLEFSKEIARVTEGADLLAADTILRECFKGMNRAIRKSAGGKYNGWRPFQFGFLLANLNSLVNHDSERDIADVVWFSTGGGKTETYLGLLVTAALYDRSRGKLSGVTAWSRFPLRMLSLQQTQRFADALGAAELIRREMGLNGDPFSLGFFVGKDSTPNKITAEEAEDRSMFVRYRVIDRCPFCATDGLKVKFNRKIWSLQHICEADGCPSGGALPFYVVDDEIYRFLPTVIVGTLDKAASVSRERRHDQSVLYIASEMFPPSRRYLQATARDERPGGG